ncbi:MAG: Uncharacterized protein CEN89_148 [Candidatus Berkelbacteria bacterium Licking1014_7]|uniref:Uncharacterized protein n=1 Tax=Candidatus Berkelbacteria bacterium Licking1014_7 TaxID=2017147 RepID=A0A554LK80_9BACT|nr:MAG: Uncharacterized protein CEN89_148 [Candidatus Berkelbacteria bacterium Licking1014_7]
MFGLDQVFGDSAQGNLQGKFWAISNYVLEIMFIVAGIVAVASIVWSGYTFITSFGDEEKAGKAKKILIYSIIGLVVVILAETAIQLIATKFTLK